MDAINKGRTIRGARRVWLSLAVAWLSLPLATVEASPIRGGAHRRSLAAQEFSGFKTPTVVPPRWSSFLAGGESTWASYQSPPFTLPVRVALLNLISGDPTIAAANPLVEYFVWRRNLNPSRFDRYHPFLGPHLPHRLVPPPTVPQIPTDPPLIPPVPSYPPVVPEPPAVFVIALGIVGALILRRRAMPV